MPLRAVLSTFVFPRETSISSIQLLCLSQTASHEDSQCEHFVQLTFFERKSYLTGYKTKVCMW